MPAFAHAGTADLSASAELSRVDFVGEVPVAGAQKLLGWSEGSLYFAQQDGTVQVVDTEGRPTLVLQAKDQKGEPVLERPEAVAVADGTVYVADSSAHHVAMFSLEGKYKGSFGARGSGAGELRSPRGIAIHEGIVYVADSGNGRIQLFGDNGIFLTTLEVYAAPANNVARERELPYKLDEPVDVDIDAAGKIYVLDANDSLVKVYHQSGIYLRHLPQNGKPVSVGVARDGIFVAEQDSYTIQKYDFTGKLANYFGSNGEGRGQFKSINGLAVDDGQHVFVGDGKRSVMQVFLTEAGPILSSASKQATRDFVRWQGDIPAVAGKIDWNGKDTIYGINKDNKSIVRIRNGVAEDEITANDVVPVAVAVDKAGALWVLDKKHPRVVKLDEKGNILASFGTEGSGPGQFDEPVDIALSNSGVIFVADRGNYSVQAFSSDGVFLKMIRNTIAGKLEKPVAIAFDPKDNLYVLDAGRSVIASFSAQGRPLAEFGRAEGRVPGNLVKPVDLMVAGDEVSVVDVNQVKVYSLDGEFIRSFGAEGNGPGEFDEPVAITAKDNTTFFVADPGNKRIQVLAAIHKPGIPENMVVRAGVHFIELQWNLPASTHVAQYRIYRSKKENTGFVQIATTKTNRFTDHGLGTDERFFYRVTAETRLGYEGPMGAAVSEIAKKFVPPPPDNVRLDPTPWQVKMSWNPFTHQYFDSYVIYQKKDGALVNIGKTTTPEFIKDALLPEASYVFYVAIRGTDGIESEKREVKVTLPASNKPPLEVSVVEMHDIFSNTYKIYEQEGVGRIKLTNYTSSAMQNIKVSFVLKSFMDYPTETKVDGLLPGKSKELTMKAVFNNNILTLTEDTSVQAQIEASYFENGFPQAFSIVAPVKVYDKHRLSWDERDRYAAFITPKDTPMINLTRSVLAQFGDASDDVQRAAAIFDTLGVFGLSYVQDPTNPYQVTSGKTDAVDYIQYPRETLERKAGDCDDLVAVYSSALESLSIPTLVVEVPGHMFMMFSTGIAADDDYTMEDMYVIHEGKLWLPVETTMVGKPFLKAWEAGAETYYKWKAKEQVTILDVRDAWFTYKPATLPESNWKPVDVPRTAIEKRFTGEFMSILKISSQAKTRRYLQSIKDNPADIDAHMQVGIILARMGDRKEALEYFNKVIGVDPGNASALNNRGNIYMLEDRYKEAQNAYLAASKADPLDPEILINLVKSYQATREIKKAKEAFVKARDLDPAITKKYKAMALELLNML